MRHSIARAILACLRTLLDLILPATGKRRAPKPVAAPVRPEPVSPWSRPWTTPSKAEAAAIFQRQAERDLQHERRQAAAYATLGVDYPYSYDGAPFGVDAFPRNPRMTREALISDFVPFGTVCSHCGRWTEAPVECHHTGGSAFHSCPDCVLMVHDSPYRRTA